MADKNNVAILALTAALRDNSRELTADVRKMVSQVEQKAGTIEFGANTKEITDAIDEIVKMANGKLKGLDLTKYFVSISKVFADSKSTTADYLNILKNIENEFSKFSNMKTSDLDLMKTFNSKQINKVLNLYDQIIERENKLAEVQAKARTKASAIESKDRISAIRKYAAGTDQYASASSEDTIKKITSVLGITDENVAKSAQKDITEYSKLLSLFQILQDKKVELAKIDTSASALETVEINKTLLELYDQIYKKEQRLTSSFGAQNVMSQFVDDIDQGKLQYALEGSITAYVTKATSQAQKSLNSAKKEINDTIVEYTLKNQERLQKQTEKNIAKVEARTQKISGSTGTKNSEQTSSQENLIEDLSAIDNKANEVTSSLKEVGTESGQLDAYAQSIENIKDEFSDVIKYAVDAETALEKCSELMKTFDTRALTDNEIKDLVGYSQRLDSLDQDIPEDVLDFTDELEEDYTTFQNQIGKMTQAQLAELEKIKSAKKEIVSQKTDDSIVSNENIVKTSEETSELVQRVEKLEGQVQELGLQFQNFDNISSIFDNINISVQKLETGLTHVNSKLEDMRYFMGNNDIAYHAGDLDNLSVTTKPESWTDRIDALLHGGFGAWGTGTYLTKDLSDLPTSRKSIYAVDLSKYRLYINKTEEQAEQLNTFLKNLEKFVLSSSDFKGFENDIKGVSVETLFAQASALFGEVNLDIKEFNSFINSMKQLVAKSGIDSEGIYHLSDLSLQGSDSIPTRFMKKLGYQGINNSGLPNYDNVEHGSVIYDLDPMDLYIKKFEKFNDVLEYNQRLLSAVQKSSNIVSDTNSSKEIQNQQELQKELKETQTEVKSTVDSFNYIEESSGQMAMFEGLEAQQNKASEAIKETNEQIKGQITLAEYAADLTKEASSNVKSPDDTKSSSGTDTKDDTEKKETELQKLKKAYEKLTECETEYQILKNKEEKNTLTEDERNRLQELTQSRVKYNTVLEETSVETDKVIKQLKDYNTEQERAKNVVSALSNTDSLLKGLQESSLSQNAPGALQRTEERIDKLNQKLIEGKISVSDYEDSVQKLVIASKNVVGAANSEEEALAKMNDYFNRVSDGAAEIGKTQKSANGNVVKLTASWKDQNGQLQKLTLSYDKVTKSISEAGSSTQKAASGLNKFFDGLVKKWQDLLKYLMSFASFHEVIQFLRQGFNIIKDLDTALTEMRKVSDETVSSLRRFQDASYDIASQVGTTATQIQNSTADWMRLGESLEEAAESAETANILLNVSEFDSIDSATESLVAMSAAYDELEKIDIVDKLNLIGNNFAISTDGLATALQASASALKTAGNDIDEAVALVTAGNQVVQDPDKVGAGLRTIALRITGTEAAKKELENLGEDTSDFLVQTSAKSQQAIKDFTKVASNSFEGFDILDENGNFKSTYEILLGISEIYEEIVETDKKFGTNMANGLLETLAGKNRANIAASILQNPEILKEAYESSAFRSEGSAQQELEKYLDSIDGKVNQLKNSWQELWATSIDSEFVKGFIDLGRGLTEAATAAGGLVPLLGQLLTIGLSLKNIGRTNNLNNQIQLFSIKYAYPY